MQPHQTSISCPYCQNSFPIQGSIQRLPEPRQEDFKPPPPSINTTRSQTTPIVIGPRPVVPVVKMSTAAFGLSEHENSWQSKFPKQFSLILGIVQGVFILLIFILEIASLGVIVGYRPTGVGIWAAIPFSIAAAMKIALGRSFSRFLFGLHWTL